MLPNFSGGGICFFGSDLAHACGIQTCCTFSVFWQHVAENRVPFDPPAPLRAAVTIILNDLTDTGGGGGQGEIKIVIIA